MKILALSPSQQEGNQFAGGGTGYADSEERWMRAIMARAKTRIDAQGWRVKCVVINEGSWQANAAKSNSIGATEHVAGHSNAGGGHGTELYYHSGSSRGKALATALYPFISVASNAPDRGIKATSSLGELNTTKAPAVLIEFAYHDNKAEAAEIRASVDEFAEAVVKGMARYYGKTYKSESNPVGLFTVKTNSAAIRATPSLLSKTLVTISKGGHLRYLNEATATYFKVKVTTHGKTYVGWVKKARVK